MEMEKTTGSGELQCVGRLEVVKPKPVGFLCGTIPISTDKSFHSFTNSALVPSSSSSSSSHTVRAPRYRMLPTETDLNMLPLLSNIPDKIIPVSAVQSKTGGDIPWENGAVTSNLSRKCEALAVSGLVEYGDELDVIGPADILKQIFKVPYSKARLSIAVHRIGQTLVLSTGPDIEEGEKLVRRHSNQSKSLDQSLFLNFAMHSVRMEACDCPPTHFTPSGDQSNSSVLPGLSEAKEDSLESSEYPQQSNDNARKEGINHHSKYPQVKKDGYVLDSKKNTRKKGCDAVTRASSQVSDKPRSSVQESEKYKRAGNDGFLRVLFWQFHNFRVLLGSDLLLFSNEKYVAVSLHLWDVTRPVTPLTWLEAWLDNVMASVPELAICYHLNGVVQGYELLKTDDIFLLKGISEDGTPAFHPQVVQQNGLSVLRFLQENCKQDPGAYWLYKSAGEDGIQLFDLSGIPKRHSSDDCDDIPSSLPSLMHGGRSDPVFSLGTLLYRIAHRLSLSMTRNNRARCARFFKKCFDFLREPEHLVVCASAHEQFARLILNYEEELDLTFESLPLESEVTFIDAEDESLDIFSSISESIVDEKFFSIEEDDKPSNCGRGFRNPMSETSVKLTLEANIVSPNEPTPPQVMELENPERVDQSLAMCEISPTTSQVVETVADPIFSKLAAIHHISQAIKSLRWKRQLQSTEQDLVDHGTRTHNRHQTMNFSVCACGDSDCIEVCDIREWLPTSKLDHKLWKLVLLLGESYLALGQAYKENVQLHRALKIVELACSVYGSMPHHFEDTIEKTFDDSLTLERFSSTYLFWAKAWTLVGDVYVEFHITKGKENPAHAERKPSNGELRMSSEVVKEVKRLKKKLGHDKQSCSSCSLINCSCQGDRVSSGSSASSSNGERRPLAYGRKQSRRSYARNTNPEASRTTEHKNTGREEGGSETLKVKNGGIFKYLGDSKVRDVDYNLSAALNCYEEARKALGVLSRTSSSELQSVVKKKGWVCNELGRIRLERKELNKAEIAFADAISAFKEVSDHVNIILINCNLGHGRRALAEEMVSKMEDLNKHTIFQNAYTLVLDTAKLEYSESLRYYGAAKSELNVTVPSDLRNEVLTQFANTYLRLGMLLARERIVAEVYEYGDTPVGYVGPSERRARKELRKHEISANDAIREALSVYESLGELRKQEAAYAYLQLAGYQRDCCLKFLDSENNKSGFLKAENSVLQKVKQYASLAERNWQKAMDFYGPETHPTMYLTILIERSALSLSLSSFFHPSAILESALSRMLEGRRVCGETTSDSINNDEVEVYAKFWSQLQMLLKKMLSLTLSNKSGDVQKLRELYKMALKCTDMSHLNTMHNLWAS